MSYQKPRNLAQFALDLAMASTTIRSSVEIFSDLKDLAQSPGALHYISGIVYRDWVLTVDTQEGKVTDEPQQRWSTDKLNKNELMLLLGLMVQAVDDRTYAHLVPPSDFAERADRLLREFHDRVIEDARSVFDPTSQKFLEGPNSLGMFAREAIYYGAESFYLHQFGKFARHRYKDDGTWLLQNAGLSIRPIVDIAQFIVERLTNQMSAVGHMKGEGHKLSAAELTNSLLVTKAELKKRFGSKSAAFIAKFATPAFGANLHFNDPFAVNQVAIAPIVDLGEFLYVPNQYRLLESIYESPFFWMVDSTEYGANASKHRGAFLEDTTAHILRKVFGDENVFINVTLPLSKKKTGGEIDVLVRYGEFVLVVQAKSKRVTLKARAGDPEALTKDFVGAIQDPYDQGLECSELIRRGVECFDANGQLLELPRLPRLVPIVILSDPFPASVTLSHTMLKREEGVAAPVVWDLGVLDCVARMLPTPIEMLFYLKCRSDVFDSAISDSEYNLLGYHIRTKLALPSDVDMLLIERDFATLVDDYMISADLGISAERPKGVLEAIEIPFVSALLGELKNAEPDISAVVIDLYDFSQVALENLGEQIGALREEVGRTGKAIKAFSLPTGSGGLTYAVTRDASALSKAAAQSIGAKHKHDTKSDRWYVILDSIQTDNPIDGLLPLVWPWSENPEADEQSKLVGEMFRSTQVAVHMKRPSADP